MYWDGINPIKMAKIDSDMFIRFYVESLVRVACLKVSGRKIRTPYYGGHKVETQASANELLKQKLNGKTAFMFGRHGTNEVQLGLHSIMCEKGITNTVITHNEQKGSCDHCGFFPPNDEALIKFGRLLIEATENTDVYGSLWLIGESYFVKHYLPTHSVVTHTNMMDFWRYEEPFTYALKGQKVLVVHYLAEQIKDQYKKRELLFDNPKVLPEFELMAMPAVQTIAGNRDPRFATWFEALDYMYEETKKYDYNVAILGCGAYGMPLAAKLKKDGKKVIYMGGVLQMLFGIKGKRWDDEPKAAALYNEHWVEPDAKFKPKQAESVEGGCYW